MENHKLMLKISRIFPSSFSSCHMRALPDVAESSIKISKQSSLSLPPSLSPNNKTLNPKTTHKPSNGGWFSSSDDLDTTDTFFSLSSYSGDSFRLRTAAAHTFKQLKSIDEAPAARKPPPPAEPRHEPGADLVSTQVYYGGAGCGRRRERRRRRRRRAVGPGSLAVEKRSSDPRGDFRASMVEMIVEKQIFAAADLERLLRCFLSLNAAAYHGIIIDVFSEICQTLFTN